MLEITRKKLNLWNIEREVWMIHFKFSEKVYQSLEKRTCFPITIFRDRWTVGGDNVLSLSQRKHSKQTNETKKQGPNIEFNEQKICIVFNNILTYKGNGISHNNWGSIACNFCIRNRNSPGQRRGKGQGTKRTPSSCRHTWNIKQVHTVGLCSVSWSNKNQFILLRDLTM